MILGIILIALAAVSRFILSPLLFFAVAEGAMIIFVVLRKKQEYGVLIAGSVVLLVAEIIAMFTGIGSSGHLFGTIVGSITALLGLGDERPKEKFIRKIGLSGLEERRKVYSAFYTFGRVERIEKVNMSQSYIYVADGTVYFSVQMIGRDNVLVELAIKDIVENSIHMAVSSTKLYYPALKDMFLPNRRVKTVGVPKVSDYFLLLRTEEDTWSFFEEPSNILALQEEIEKRRV